MSVSLTLDAVRERRKTVTRRHVDTWRTLAPGDSLTLIEKGMGLPKGAHQVVVAEVVVVDVRVEPLGAIRFECEDGGTEREGLGHLSPGEFEQFWLDTHGHRNDPAATTLCRRIEWRYLDEQAL